MDDLYDLDRQIHIRASEYPVGSGRKSVDIRKYYEKDGEVLPTTKGINLTIEQWNSLVNKLSEIQEFITRKLG